MRFIRFEPEKRPEVELVEGKLEVRVFDQNLKAGLRLRPDWIALSAAIRPAAESRSLAQTLKLPFDADGFFLEAHIKLRPLDFANAGMFLCGLGHGPKALEESIAQAKGAAARAATVLAQKHDHGGRAGGRGERGPVRGLSDLPAGLPFQGPAHQRATFRPDRPGRLPRLRELRQRLPPGGHPGRALPGRPVCGFAGGVLGRGAQSAEAQGA